MIANAITSAFRIHIKGNVHPLEKTPMLQQEEITNECYLNVTRLWIAKNTSTSFEAEMHVEAGSGQHFFSGNLYNTWLFICIFNFVSILLKLIVVCEHSAHYLSIREHEQHCDNFFIRLCVADLWVFVRGCFVSLSQTCWLKLSCSFSLYFKQIWNTKNIVVIYVVVQLSGSLACVMR